MADMRHIADPFGKRDAQILRPVGLWRFLTPLEHLQEGDLFRCVPNDNVEGDDPENNRYEFNWTTVTADSSHIEDMYGDLPQFEVIRAVDETSYTVPMFKERNDHD